MVDTRNQARTSDRPLVFNGVNGSTGTYLLEPLSLADLSAYVSGVDLGANHPLRILQRKYQRDTEQTYGVSDDVGDPSDLAYAGWGVIFPRDIGQNVLDGLRDALKPLLDLRKEQAGKITPIRYREFVGPQGYLPGESAVDWLARHGKSAADPAEPDIVPYYLLLVGSPAAIPFVFQYQLDVIYGVGRLHFDPLSGDKLEDVLARYARYAQTTVAAEKALERGEGFRARRAIYFGVRNDDTDATALSADQLVKPLYEQLRDRRTNWTHELVEPADAKKERLGHLLTDDTPGLLFTASHGMGFDLNDPRQERHQGALLCGEWPGEEEWRGRGSIPESYYFSADDISGDARLQGMITFHFACFGGGTPALDDFALYQDGKNRTIAKQDMIAHLPQRLLGHEKGGPLAILAHVDRTWDYSFSWGDLQKQTIVFRDTVNRLMRGERAGWATEVFNSRYAALSSNLTTELDQINKGRIPNQPKLVGMWTANNDARSYVVLGDPAARLPLAPENATPAAPPELTFNLPVTISGGDSTPTATTAATSSSTASDGGTATKGATTAISGAILSAVEPAALVASNTGISNLISSNPEAFGLESTGLDFGHVIGPLFHPESVGLDFGQSTGSAHYQADENAAQPLVPGLRRLAASLGAVLQNTVDNLGSLEVSTYASPDMNSLNLDKDGRPIGAVVLKAMTRMDLNGDAVVFLPEKDDKVDDSVWAIHSELLQRSLTARAEMFKVLGETFTSLTNTLKAM